MFRERLPNFYIVGAQKSASTYVHLALRKHPEVCMPGQEIDFFEDPAYGSGDPRTLEGLFERCQAPMRGVKRPNYLAQPEVPGRIAALTPSAKLIAVLREPLARLMSAYHYYMKIGVFPLIPFAEGLTRLLDGDSCGSPYGHEILEYGRYGTHLDRYLEHFPLEQICVVLHDDIVTDEARVLAGITDFLGISRFLSQPRVPRDNAGLYSLERLAFLRHRNRFLFRYVPQKREFGLRTGIIPWVAAAAITAADRAILAPLYRNGKPQMPAPLRARLKAYYRPEVERLEEILRRPIPAWS